MGVLAENACGRCWQRVPVVRLAENICWGVGKECLWGKPVHSVMAEGKEIVKVDICSRLGDD